MKKQTSPLRSRSHFRFASIEPLEARIAPAAVVSVTGGNLSVLENANGDNSLTISISGANYHFVDTVHGLTAGAGATASSAGVVDVPIASVSGNFTVTTSGGVDAITLGGGFSFPGNLSVNTGTGATDSILRNGASSTVTSAATFTSEGAITFDGLMTVSGQFQVTAGTTLTVSESVVLTADTFVFASGREILLNDTAGLTLTGNSLSLTANAGGTGTGNFSGITLDGASIVSTGTGTITLTGTGGDTGVADSGIYLLNGATVTGGTGTVVLHGVGGTGSGNNQHGVVLVGVGTVVTSTGGDVALEGIAGGTGSGGEHYAVNLQSGALVSAGGTGAVDVTGTGSSTQGGQNVGVGVILGATITSSGGAVTVTGTGGSSPGGANYGVALYDGGTITSGTGGNVNVTGTGGTGGGTNDGVRLDDLGTADTISSGGGTVSVAGSAGTGSYGINLHGTLDSITTVANGGDVTLTARSINLEGTISAGGTDAVTFQAIGFGTSVELGGADASGVLGLTDAELDQVTAPKVVIDTSLALGGGIAVTAAITHGNHLQLVSSGLIAFNGLASINTGTKDLSLAANGSITSGTATTDVIGGTVSLAAGGSGIGTAINPLTMNATSLSTNTAGLGGLPQFLSEANSVTFTSLSAGAQTITLVSGTFAASANNVINNNTSLAVNGTLDLRGFTEGIGDFSGSGTITNSVAASFSELSSSGSGNTTFSGLLEDGAGSLNLTHTGAGTLTLTGANTLTGFINITGGAVKLGHANAARNSSISLSSSNGLQFASGITAFSIGGLSGASNLTLTNAAAAAVALTVGGNSTASSYDGSISGAGSLVKVGSSSLQLGGLSSFSGGTTIERGTITFSKPTALGTGLITLNTVNTGASATSLLATAVMNTQDLAGGSQGNFINNIVVANFGTGETLIGTTAFTGSVASGFNSTVFAGSVTLNRDTTFIGRNTDRTSFDGVISGTLGTFTIRGGSPTRIGGSAANTFSGDIVVIDAGTTVQLGESPNAVPDRNSIFLASGTNLALAKDITGTETINYLTGAGTVLVQSGVDLPQTLILDTNAGSGTFAGLITDNSATLAIVKRGIGTEIFSGSNDYSGGTTIIGGTLRVDSVGGALSGAFSLGGGTLAYNLGGSQTISPSVTLTANAIVSVAAGSRVDWNGNAVAGVNFNFTKTGPGALSHTGAWNVKAILVQGGALVAAGTNAFGTDPVDISSGAAFWAEGNGITVPNALTLRGIGESVAAAGTAYPGALVHNFGGGLATFTGAILLAADTSIGTDGGDLLLSGKLTGSSQLEKVGANTLTLGNSGNTLGLDAPTTLTVSGGILAVASDRALGDPGNSIVFAGGSLKTTAGFTSNRHFTKNNDATIDVTGTLKLLGLVDGPGVIHKTGPGTLLFSDTYVGGTTVSAGSGPVTLGTANFAITGTGDAVITVIPDGAGGTKIDTIVLSNTTAATNVVIKGPAAPGATVVVDKILSLDPGLEVGSITLKKGVLLGDGTADGEDVSIAGRLGRFTAQDIAPGTIIRLGYGLPYNLDADLTTPDTYNNHPKLNIQNILGAGVVIDVTGDGTPSGIGGGGLDTVVIKSWNGDGTIRTTQSIKSFLLKFGDCHVTFEVDKFHNGAATTANMGKITIPNGAWGSSGSVIEGTVGVFNATAFLAGATMTAGSLAKFRVKTGDYAGTITLTDPAGGKLGSFTVGGDFTGFVNSVEPVINVIVKGTFKGSLLAASIGTITANKFIGTAVGDLIYGAPDRLDIISNGSLGTIKAIAGGIRDYEIVAQTIFNGFNIPQLNTVDPAVGIENVLVEAGQINTTTIKLSGTDALLSGIRNSVFESVTTIGAITSTHGVSTSLFAAGKSIGVVKIGTVSGGLTQSKFLAGASLGGDGQLGGLAPDTFFRGGIIGDITVSGAVTNSTIEAGIDPVDGIFGNPGDLPAHDDLTTAPTGTHYSIGSLKFGSSGTALPGPVVDPLSHTNAIEAFSIKNLILAGGPTLTKTSAGLNYGGPLGLYLRADVAPAPADMLVRLI